MTDESKRTCLACERDSAAVPILQFEYRGESHAICSQHLPLLIHDPAKLADRLPGADRVPPG